MSTSAFDQAKPLLLTVGTQNAAGLVANQWQSLADPHRRFLKMREKWPRKAKDPQIDAFQIALASKLIDRDPKASLNMLTAVAESIYQPEKPSKNRREAATAAMETDWFTKELPDRLARLDLKNASDSTVAVVLKLFADAAYFGRGPEEASTPAFVQTLIRWAEQLETASPAPSRHGRSVSQEARTKRACHQPR